jgi:hypothetical protein
LHDVHDGAYDEMPVSLKFVNERYAHIMHTPDNFEVLTKRFG